MTDEILKTVDYQDFIVSLKHKVQAAQIEAARSVNTQLIALYWELGQLLTEKQQTSGWRDAVID